MNPPGKPAAEIRLECNGDGGQDEYFIGVSKEGHIILRSKNPRSLLFAVYTFLETCMDFRFFHIGEDTSPEKILDRLTVPEENFFPAFKRRGLILEHVNNMEKANAIIDFIAKNRGNAVFMHFTDLEKCGEQIVREVKKRGLELTVGGHSCSRFLSEKPNHEKLYGERIQLCYCNRKVKDELFKNIKAYLEKHDGIDRFSLWPSDSKFDCGCEKCAKLPFNLRYVRFMDELQVFLADHGLAAKVEHIAYNAGLEESMMRIPQMEPDDGLNCDTLFAYWGRDYRFRFDKSPLVADHTGIARMREWAAFRHPQPTNDFTVLEYYNDFWMLTGLFPFLTDTIAGDIEFYNDIGVDGVMSLIVPPKDRELSCVDYPYLWIMSINSRLLLRGLWDCKLDTDKFRADYIAKYYGGNSKAKMMMNAIEEILPEVSRFNQPLFRLRLPDIWLVDDLSNPEFSPQPWTPEVKMRPIDREREELCKKAVAKFEAVHAVLPFSDSEECPNVKKLENYFAFLSHSFNSLTAQIEMQKLKKRL